MFSNHTIRNSSWRWAAIAATIVTLLMSACSTASAPAAAPEAIVTQTPAVAEESQTTLPEIAITARDFAFDMPAEIPSGWVSLTLTNEGEVNHHGIVMRLLDGVTLDDALAAMGDEEGDLAEISDLEFFLPDTDPGSSNQATVAMAPGHWIVLSVSMDASTDGEMTPDFVRGSIAEFDVVESDAMAAPPEPDVTLTIGADDFDLPTELGAGQHTIHVVNNSGQENGYAFILKMENGATIDDVMAMFDALFSGQEMDMENMPVFHAVGGLMAYNLSDSYYTTVDLTPGDYTVISNIGGTEFPYAGVNKSFTVAGDDSADTGSTEAVAEIPAVTIEVNDDGFVIPDDFPGGIVAVTVQNNGSKDMDVSFLRIQEGASVDEIKALADDLMANWVPLQQLTNGMPSFNPVYTGESEQITIDFRTGQFLVVANEHVDADPPPGTEYIWGEFAADELVGTAEPQTAVKVEFHDFYYVMPNTVAPGKQVWEYSNMGDQWHMMLVLKLAPGATMEDAMNFLMTEGESSGPPPFEDAHSAGLAPIGQGERAWVEFSLDPGTYLAVCPLPDMAAMMNGERTAAPYGARNGSAVYG